MHSFGSEAWRPFCLQICTCRIDRVSWTRGTRIRHSVKNWMVKTEEWTFDTLKECYCLNYTYRGSIKTWAHSYSGKARKTCFSQAGDRPTTPRCPRNVSGAKMKNRFWCVILDDGTILDDDVMYTGQTTRDLIKIYWNRPNHHPKQCFHEYSCTGSSACEIWTHNSQ